QVAAMKAVFDASAAQLRESELEFKRTEIRSTVAGIVQEPLAERGDLLRIGDVCATVIDSDPMIITGQISERFVNSLSAGMEAAVSVITGAKREGIISYVSTSADAATRTFRVDIEVPNSDESLRDGVTAIAHIPLQPVPAHLIAPSMLTLSAEGVLGMRTVDTSTNINKFMKVIILGETNQGLWVSGLPSEVTVITIGQEYVIDDQIVDPVFAEAAQ
ncbi:MAG: efflux RND transporter periplasmic adaptor subunit, partial [Rhizobiales bacterium]|nr:efflux RND transporter periplasmic adaptor subunit [Hyphomicrobiales bacterium]